MSYRHLVILLVLLVNLFPWLGSSRISVCDLSMVMLSYAPVYFSCVGKEQANLLFHLCDECTRFTCIEVAQGWTGLSFFVGNVLINAESVFVYLSSKRKHGLCSISYSKKITCSHLSLCLCVLKIAVNNTSKSGPSANQSVWTDIFLLFIFPPFQAWIEFSICMSQAVFRLKKFLYIVFCIVKNCKGMGICLQGASQEFLL